MSDADHKVFQLLRQCKLDHLLQQIGNAMRGMFERNEPVMSVPAARLDELAPAAGNVTVASSALSDLAYYAIKESSDFAPRVTSVHDLSLAAHQRSACDDAGKNRSLVT
jgi:hypothetical protein